MLVELLLASFGKWLAWVVGVFPVMPGVLSVNEWGVVLDVLATTGVFLDVRLLASHLFIALGIGLVLILKNIFIWLLRQVRILK